MADETPRTPGLQAVHLVWDEGEEVPPPPAASAGSAPGASAVPGDGTRGDRAPDPPPDHGRGGRRRDADDRRVDGLPEDCPVIPLGVSDKVAYYLDDLRQLREVKDSEHTRLGIQYLFGRKAHLLFKFWPRLNAKGGVTGWRPEEAAMELTQAVSRRGVWDPMDKLRGSGAWIGEDGRLVWHAGDEVLIGDEWHDPGLQGGLVYPASKPILKPAAVAQAAGDDGPAAAVLAMLRSWNWARPEIDPVLKLGWIVAALAGGALKWRPVCWDTGGFGTGKSTLHEFMRLMFDGALTTASDATAAGIRDNARYSTLPIAIDEAEPDEEGPSIQALIRLARAAASGSIAMRSSATNTAKQFQVRQCFLFSSILVPSLMPADRSRIAILELRELKNEAPPRLEPKRMRALGAGLLRRLVDQWERFPQALEAYRVALMSAGHSGRGGDVFGTLLACADLAMSDKEVDSDSALEWADRIGTADAGGGLEGTTDQERCIRHVATTVLPFDGVGDRRNVAQWATRVAKLPELDHDRVEAERILGNAGLRILKDAAQGNELVLAVANDHQGVGRIFAHTHWAARPGAQGVWVQALRRLPLARPSGKNVRIGGVACKATYVPASLIVDPEYEPAGGAQLDYE